MWELKICLYTFWSAKHVLFIYRDRFYNLCFKWYVLDKRLINNFILYHSTAECWRLNKLYRSKFIILKYLAKRRYFVYFEIEQNIFAGLRRDSLKRNLTYENLADRGRLRILFGQFQSQTTLFWDIIFEMIRILNHRADKLHCSDKFFFLTLIPAIGRHESSWVVSGFEFSSLRAILKFISKNLTLLYFYGRSKSSSLFASRYSAWHWSENLHVKIFACRSAESLSTEGHDIATQPPSLDQLSASWPSLLLKYIL